MERRREGKWKGKGRVKEREKDLPGQCQTVLYAPDGQANTALYSTIRYDTRCYFNERSKANMGQLNLPHGTGN